LLPATLPNQSASETKISNTKLNTLRCFINAC
jgi:hypothetical protein